MTSVIAGSIESWSRNDWGLSQGALTPRAWRVNGTDRPRTVAGYPGFYNLLEAISDPEHEQHEELLEWLGGDFDPEAFSVDGVNRRLASLQRRRNKAAGKK
jgi:hypothetical protein